MNKRMTALLLALVMACALGAPRVLAEGEGAERPTAQPTVGQETRSAEASGGGQPAAEEESAAGQTAPPENAATPENDTQAAANAAEAQENDDAQTTENDGTETADGEPLDPEGTLTFGNLGARMLANYYPLRALQESVDDIEGHDYDWQHDRLRVSMNELAKSQWMMVSLLHMNQTSDALGTVYEQMRKEYEDIEKGEKQKDDQTMLWQLRNAQNQTVIVGETLYITLKGLEAQDASLTRTIAQLGRTEQEMSLRCELGQVSKLAVDQVSAGRAQAVSGRETLRMNREAALLQLRSMVGAELDAPLALGALPKVTSQELAAMDLEADLEKAKAASYALFDAKKQLDDFRKDTKDAYDQVVDLYGSNKKTFEVSQLDHALQAYQYNYENTLLTYELNFRTLYAQVKDCAQVLSAKRAALAEQEKSYAVSALKYEQGNISANALADAKDELSAAKDDVSAAERELFSKYRSYTWAVEYGILNA